MNRTDTPALTARPEAGEPQRRLRCALFVDFDNVYLGLRRLDPEAAEAFAGSPAHWLSALETGTDADGDFTRRFLVRACYLNPSAFSQFRPNFTRAGFSVVDCPSLTQQGKSSADINLVLDAVDALSAGTRYDEFVIVSADADFTPLALRCRAADRRVTIVTAGPAASAYRAVADTVVTADELVELVRPPAPDVDRQGSVPGEEEPAGAGAAPAAAPAAAAPRRRGSRARAVKPSEPADDVAVAPATPAAASGSAAPADAPAPPAAGPEQEAVVDPDVVVRPARATRTRASRAAGPPASTESPAQSPTRASAGKVSPSPARRALLRLARSADRPVTLEAAARTAQRSDPALVAGGWDGAGTLLDWVATAVPELGHAVRPAPGYLWDPQRFSEADLPSAAAVDLPPLQRQVVEVTDIPNLPREHYRFLLTALADDVAAHPFVRHETARRVRDACQAAGQPIGRASVNAVISAVLFAGLDLTGPTTPQTVAATWADNVVGLCRGARMELGPQDVAALRDWVGGGLLEP